MATSRSLYSDISSIDDYQSQSGSDFFLDSHSETYHSDQTGNLTNADDILIESTGSETFITSCIDPTSSNLSHQTSNTTPHVEELTCTELVLDSNFEDSSLGVAIYNNDVEAVKYLLSNLQLVNRNVTYNHGKTALHVACMLGNKAIVELLLNAGWRSIAQSKQLRTPLHEATIAGHHQLYSLLVEKESKELNAQDKYGYTAIHLAALHGETRCLIELVEMECDTSVEDKYGRLPSHLAASRGHLATLKAMSENGFDIDGEDNVGWLPAHYAAEAGSLECIKFMSKHGIDIVSADTKGWEPIHQASAADELESLKFFTAHGSKITDRDNYGRNVAHIAAVNGSVKCLHWMLECNTNPNVRDKNRNTLSHLAALKGSSESIYCIKMHYGEMNLPNRHNVTPLQMAKNNGKVTNWEKGLSGERKCKYCSAKAKEIDKKEVSKSIGIHADIELATQHIFSIGKIIVDNEGGGQQKLGKPRMPKGHKGPPKQDIIKEFTFKRDLAAIFYGPTA